MNRQLLSTITNMVILCLINKQGLKGTLYPVVTFVASFLVSFFNLLFSKYVLKIVTNFLTSSKDG